MKPIQDDELERDLAEYRIKSPREGFRERVLANSRAAWNLSDQRQPAAGFQISWALSGWLVIAATLLFLLNLGVDSFNRNAVQAPFGVNPSQDDLSSVAAMQAFADALRQRSQDLKSSELY